MLARIFGAFETTKHRTIDFSLRSGGNFVSIGSNKDEFAIHAALVVGTQEKVVAFEPEPGNCGWIKRSLRRSAIDDVILEEAAIGVDDDHVNLYIGAKSGWHSLVRSESQNPSKEPESVRVHKLDSYLESNPLPNLKVIKISVEGYEKEAPSRRKGYTEPGLRFSPPHRYAPEPWSETSRDLRYFGPEWI